MAGKDGRLSTPDFCFMFLCLCSFLFVLCCVFCFFLWFCFVFMFCVLCFALNEGRWRRKMGDFQPQIFFCVCVCVLFSLFFVPCSVLCIFFVVLFCVFGVLHSMREVGGKKWATFNPRVVSYTCVLCLCYFFFVPCSVLCIFLWFCFVFVFCVLHSMREDGGERWATFNPRRRHFWDGRCLPLLLSKAPIFYRVATKPARQKKR